MANDKHIAVRIPLQLCNLVDSEAQDELLSRADIIRRALLHYYKSKGIV
ncbi:ribbon-helix-helix protein, CopG family [Nostoc sp. ChiQUE01b]|nr:ribbon-helix-helix protein, CopG family [Nostoc sp. ChiQUE01b]